MTKRLLALVLTAAVVVGAGCVRDVTTSTELSTPGSTTSPASATTAPPPATGEGPPVTAQPVTTEASPAEDTTTTTAPVVLRIGALFPLSGELEAQGASALKGMRLAVEEINATGGIASLGGLRLTLVEADSKGDSGEAETEVARLVQEEGVAAIVGTAQSTVALQATEAAERLEVPFLVSSGAADEITERGLGYTFRLCPKMDWYARDQVAFVRALGRVLGAEITAVALLHEDGEYGRQTAEDQKRYLAEWGIEVVEDVEYSPEQADVHNEMLTIKQSSAQAVLTATLLSDAALIAQDAETLHVHLPIVDAAGGMLDPGFLDNAGNVADGMMSVAEYASGPAGSRALENRMAASNIRVDADLLYAYQAVYVLASALERGGSAEGPRLRAALKTTALYGERLVLPQDLLMFDSTGQNLEARLVAVQVQGRKMVTVWPAEFAGGAVMRAQ